jgi:hypothetical protein
MPFDMSPTSVHAIFLVSLMTTAGLVAAWAALSPRHRLLRVAGFVSLPLALWVAPAPELVTRVLITMSVIVVLLVAARFVVHAPYGRTFASLPKLRFRLATLFYTTFLAGLIAAAVSVLWP